MNDNDKSTMRASRIWQKTAVIADHPKLFPNNSKFSQTIRGDLEQLKYRINIRLDNMKSKQSMLVATSPYINDCLGTEVSILETKERNASKHQLTASFPSEFHNLKILAACSGDFHTLVLTKGSVLFPDSEDDTIDLYGFGQNIYGQVTGNSLKKQIIRPEIIPFFIDKDVKLIDAKGTRSVAVIGTGDIYEWGFPDIEPRRTGYLEVLFYLNLGN